MLRAPTVFLSLLLLSAGCAQTDRYNAIAASCQTYAVALNTLAAMNRTGSLTPESQTRIDATIPPARTVCTGPAPTDDLQAANKISAAVIAVLLAQQEAK